MHLLITIYLFSVLTDMFHTFGHSTRENMKHANFSDYRSFDNQSIIRRRSAPKFKRNSSGRLPSTQECIADQFNYAILKGCLCYLFQSTGQNSGKFRTPGVGFWQSNSVTCLIFTFVGDVEELVRIEITRLRSKTLNTSGSMNNCRNYVRVFTKLERAELNQNDSEQAKMCTTISASNSRIFLSTGRVLILHLQAENVQEAASFMLEGIYEFNNSDSHRMRGVLISGTICDRLFIGPKSDSTIPYTGLLEGMRYPNLNSGRFFSPRFPENYTQNLSCNYYFISNANMQTSLELQRIRLAMNDECIAETGGDLIEIFEIKFGEVPKTNLQSLQKQFTQLNKRICGYSKDIKLISLGSSFLLRFKSATNSPTDMGFEGTFRFISQKSIAGIFENHIAISEDNSTQRHSAIDEEPFKYRPVDTIHHIWNNELNSKGSINSPRYPESIPIGTRLVYIFHIPKGTQLLLEILELALSNYHLQECSKSTDNRVEFQRNTESEPFLILCGIPADLGKIESQFGRKSITADAPTLCVEVFITKHDRYQSNKFVFIYSYEQRFPNQLPWNDNPIIDNGVTEHGLRTNDCSYKIDSRGHDMLGHIHFAPLITSALESAKSKNVLRQSPNCTWSLAGEPGQRIQIKLKKRDVSSTYSSKPHAGLMQYDEQRGKGGGLQKETRLAHQANPLMDSFACTEGFTLELIHYQELMKNLEQSSLSGSYRATHSKYPAENVTPSDPVRLCLDSYLTNLRSKQILMSGDVPRVDIVLSVDKDSKLLTLPRLLFEKLNEFDLEIEYQFVTDYAVIAPFGVQHKPDCYFEFNSAKSRVGNFSSPNYPGVYPTDLACYYKFHGYKTKKIVIEFLEFDVESATQSCSDDRMSDYVELRSCYPLEVLQLNKRRLCQSASPNKPYRIEWFESCLLLRFHSNRKYVAGGFFGVYEFHNIGCEIIPGLYKFLIWMLWLNMFRM